MRTLLLVMLMMFATSPQAAKFYKWVDKDGVVHYDATPPKDQPTTEVSASDRKAEAAAKAAAEQAEETAAAPAEVPAKPIVDLAACTSARANYATLTSNPTINRQDAATGKTVRLNAAEVDAALVEAKQQIEQYCEKSG